MTERTNDKATPATSEDPGTPASERGLRAEPAPLKREGDALRDGSGSRQGQSPPKVQPTDAG